MPDGNEVYDAGYKAALDGKTALDNPHAVFKRPWMLWNLGYQGGMISLIGAKRKAQKEADAATTAAVNARPLDEWARDIINGDD